ncbi:hypothetical protein GCM10009836_73250 [Pseudonocardia ailaonensis]|uniref:Uncharacterized protein n=1 Tax=Pseudonocardia ailaonensis TaxID=367279 RepID=A0ABN2NSV6_9PSEU
MTRAEATTEGHPGFVHMLVTGGPDPAPGGEQPVRPSITAHPRYRPLLGHRSPRRRREDGGAVT